MVAIKDLKKSAIEGLGNRIFGNTWLLGLVLCLVYSIIASAISSTGVLLLILGGILEMSYSNAFLVQAREGSFTMDSISKPFNGDNFTRSLVVYLLTTLYIFLWSLLFIIPGIICSYRYSIVFYLLNDHPEYDYKKCMEESKRMMHGYKMKRFILDLSFLGWFILGILTAGIILLWVVPYYEATVTRFYLELVQENGEQPQIQETVAQ